MAVRHANHYTKGAVFEIFNIKINLKIEIPETNRPIELKVCILFTFIV